MPSYFQLLYRLRAEDRYLIWISDQQDSVLIGRDGFIPSIPDPASLRAYADRNQFALQTERPVLHDLDWVVAWIADQTIPVDCEKALAAWNLFSDVARSSGASGLPFVQLDTRFPVIYDKLFWGNNLPSVTPAGEWYVPAWSLEEIASLAEVFRVGLEVFEARTQATTF